MIPSRCRQLSAAVVACPKLHDSRHRRETVNENQFDKWLRRGLGRHSVVTRRTQPQDGYSLYKPDYTLRRGRSGPVMVIVEFETTPSRKTVLGDLVKAEKFAEDAPLRLHLLIVVKERSNTTACQLRTHLHPYFHWLKKKRSSAFGVQELLIISDHGFRNSVSTGLPIGSKGFRGRCLIIR